VCSSAWRQPCTSTHCKGVRVCLCVSWCESVIYTWLPAQLRAFRQPIGLRCAPCFVPTRTHTNEHACTQAYTHTHTSTHTYTHISGDAVGKATSVKKGDKSRASGAHIAEAKQQQVRRASPLYVCVCSCTCVCVVATGEEGQPLVRVYACACVFSCACVCVVG